MSLPRVEELFMREDFRMLREIIVRAIRDAVGEALSKIQVRPVFRASSPDWRWEPYRYINRVVEPGGSWTVWDRCASGYIYYVLVVTDNPDVRFKLDLHADGRIEIDVSPRELYEVGAVGNIGIHIMKSDTVWAIEYAPGLTGFPGTPFRGRARCEIHNPTVQPANIILLQAWVIIEEPGGGRA